MQEVKCTISKKHAKYDLNIFKNKNVKYFVSSPWELYREGKECEDCKELAIGMSRVGNLSVERR